MAIYGPVQVSGFSLESSYTCTTEYIQYTDNSGNTQSLKTFNSDRASTAQQTIVFNYSLPAGAKVIKATVTATMGMPAYGVARSRINGINVGYNTTQSVPVEIDPSGSSVAVLFYFQGLNLAHDHSSPGTYDGAATIVPNEFGNGYSIIYKRKHVGVMRYSNVYLTIEYEDPYKVSEWTLDKTTAEAGETLTVDITPDTTYLSGYWHTVQARCGSASGELITLATGVDTTTIPTNLEWLAQFPDSTTGETVVTVTTYHGEKLVGATSKTVTLTCPESAVPTLDVQATRLLEVDGATYPDVTGGYVQHKSGVLAEIVSAAGVYGSTIKAHSISIHGPDGELYSSDSGSLTALLDVAGDLTITYTVTDSRGMTTKATRAIYVEPYAPPYATFEAWRADEAGEPDEHSTRVLYEYNATHYDLGGTNPLTVTLTAQDKTAQNPPESGVVLPGATLVFDALFTYGVELAVADAYETRTYIVILKPGRGMEVHVDRSKRKGKRALIIGDYHTAKDGLWTLSALKLTDPDFQQNLVSVPGRVKGPLDLSFALTDGRPTFNSRTLTATLECSEGTRRERNDRIMEMTNALHGRKLHIVHPDDPTRYLVGRVSVAKDYSDMAHAAVTVTVTCEPWKYSEQETRIELTATEAEQRAVLPNDGWLEVVPDVSTTGNVNLTIGAQTWELEAGAYRLPDLRLPHGSTVIQYSGSGNLVFRYREAVL